jgi:hypothetical protein
MCVYVTDIRFPDVSWNTDGRNKFAHLKGETCQKAHNARRAVAYRKRGRSVPKNIQVAPEHQRMLARIAVEYERCEMMALRDWLRINASIFWET